MDVIALRPEWLPLTYQYFLTLPYYPTDWDLDLSREQHAKLNLHYVTQDLNRLEGLAAVENDRVKGVIVFGDHEWNSRFFETKCGQITHFFADGKDAATALAEATARRLVEQRYQHVYIALDVRGRWESHALQRTGWRVIWANVKIVCDLRDVDISQIPTKAGDLEVVKFEDRHLPALLEIAGRLTDYSWLQWEEKLRFEHRNTYIRKLTETCCTTDFSPLTYTLLKAGAPIGHISSRLCQYPPELGGTKFTSRRNIFIDPAVQSAGYGRFLGGANSRFDKPHATYATARARLEGAAALRMVASLGYQDRGGELYHVFDGK